MKKIIVIGSCNTDMVIKSDRLPVPGETILGGTFLMNPGGKGANQAVTVARMGGMVTFIAKTGNDIFGKQSVELYHSENINTDFIFSDANHPSGVALISVDAHGENCIVVASGANAHLDIKDMDGARTEIESGDILLMQLEIPIETVDYAANIAKEKGIKIILNPAPAQSLPVSLIEKLYLITPNKTEAEILSGIKVTDIESAKNAAIAISEKGVENVVITLGTDGALIKEGDTFHKVDSYKVETVDTTAAGDTFNGALCVGIAEGMSILDSVKMASKASALTVTRMGAQSSIPYRRELTSLE
ncbi:Ribokinase [uncultured Dysgonomonas sp.]|uniref:Ribokinase n=1 Tax=uncultured Dysgonomonas sp. TaxID=206096 RepID=A0A212J7G4_9BACT|nr:ribokinase [uncultured Dysgonomonas sp.]SBV95397.1 Ribokinase [uncultured Dysgonomonas sp.]